jgi:hypothetical protein
MKTPPIGTKVLVTHLAIRTPINLSCSDYRGEQIIMWKKEEIPVPIIATITGARRCYDGIHKFAKWESPGEWVGYTCELYPTARVNIFSKEKIIAGWEEL